MDCEGVHVVLGRLLLLGQNCVLGHAHELLEIVEPYDGHSWSLLQNNNIISYHRVPVNHHLTDRAHQITLFKITPSSESAHSCARSLITDIVSAGRS